MTDPNGSISIKLGSLCGMKEEERIRNGIDRPHTRFFERAGTYEFQVCVCVCQHHHETVSFRQPNMAISLSAQVH